jgi:hypothetical protein
MPSELCPTIHQRPYSRIHLVRRSCHVDKQKLWMWMKMLLVVKAGEVEKSISLWYFMQSSPRLEFASAPKPVHIRS